MDKGDDLGLQIYEFYKKYMHSISDENMSCSKLQLQIYEFYNKYMYSISDEDMSCSKLQLHQMRKTLEGLVAEYLSIAPQHRKFVSATTGDIISNSAKWKPDFSFYKAAQAFRDIEQYAENLIFTRKIK